MVQVQIHTYVLIAEALAQDGFSNLATVGGQTIVTGRLFFVGARMCWTFGRTVDVLIGMSCCPHRIPVPKRSSLSVGACGPLSNLYDFHYCMGMLPYRLVAPRVPGPLGTTSVTSYIGIGIICNTLCQLGQIDSNFTIRTQGLEVDQVTCRCSCPFLGLGLPFENILSLGTAPSAALGARLFCHTRMIMA